MEVLTAHATSHSFLVVVDPGPTSSTVLVKADLPDPGRGGCLWGDPIWRGCHRGRRGGRLIGNRRVQGHSDRSHCNHSSGRLLSLPSCFFRLGRLQTRAHGNGDLKGFMISIAKMELADRATSGPVLPGAPDTRLMEDALTQPLASPRPLVSPTAREANGFPADRTLHSDPDTGFSGRSPLNAPGVVGPSRGAVTAGT